MHWLCFTILLSAAFNLMMKHAHVRGYGVLAVGCLNYVVAGLAAGGASLGGATGPLSVAALGYGCLGGTMYVLCYVFIMVMLERQGISLATVVTRLAIVVPIVAGVALWGERPTAWQTAGLALSFAAIVAIHHGGWGAATAGRWSRWWPLLGCFATAGVSRLSQRAFSHFCDPSQRPYYVAAWFGCAGVIAVGIMFARRIRPRGLDWPFGAALGLVNAATLYCSITALGSMPGIVFFPVTAVGSLVLVLLLAAVAYHERLDRRSRWGIALSVVAVVLVNLRGA